MRAILPAALALIVASSSAAAMSAKAYETSGKAVALAMPAFAATLAISKRDWKGLVQLTLVTGLTYGTAYGLKHLVRECRPFAKPCTPGGNNWDSFPSTTSAISSASSSFVWNRYGWEWGLPVFVVSKYSSYALDKAHKNRIWDGLGSMALAWGYNSIFTTRYRQTKGFYTNLDGGPDGTFAQIGYRW